MFAYERRGAGGVNGRETVDVWLSQLNLRKYRTILDISPQLKDVWRVRLLICHTGNTAHGVCNVFMPFCTYQSIACYTKLFGRFFFVILIFYGSYNKQLYVCVKI